MRQAYPQVARRGHPFIPLVDDAEARVLPGVFIQNRAAAVRRAVVNAEAFPVRQGLVPDGVQAGRKLLFIPVHRDDDAEQGGVRVRGHEGKVRGAAGSTERARGEYIFFLRNRTLLQPRASHNLVTPRQAASTSATDRAAKQILLESKASTGTSGLHRSVKAGEKMTMDREFLPR